MTGRAKLRLPCRLVPPKLLIEGGSILAKAGPALIINLTMASKVLVTEAVRCIQGQGTTAIMSKKIMNPQRWRLLLILVLINALAIVLCIPFYLQESTAKRSILLGLLAILALIALAGMGVIFSLWRRFPVSDDDHKNETR